MTAEEIAGLDAALEDEAVVVEKLPDRAVHLVEDRREAHGVGDPVWRTEVTRVEVERELDHLLGPDGARRVGWKEMRRLTAMIGLGRIARQRALAEASKRLTADG